MRHWVLHQWEPVAVSHGHGPVIDWGTARRAAAQVLDGTDVAATLILYRCPCGKVKTDKVYGTFTLAQIKGEVDAR